MSWCDEKSASPAIMPLQIKVYKKNKVGAGEGGDGDIFRHIHTNIFQDSSQSRQRGGEGLFVYCKQPVIFYCGGKEEDYISTHGPWTILHKILLVKYDTSIPRLHVFALTFVFHILR